KRSCGDPNLSLQVEGEADLAWKGGEWEKMNGTGKVSSVEVAKTGYRLQTPGPVSVSIRSGRVQAERVVLEGDHSRLSLQLKGNVDGTGIDTRVQGDSSLKLIEFFSPAIEE